MIFLDVSSVFDGDGDDSMCIIVTTRAMARAILDSGLDSAIWNGEPTEEQRELIEAGINSVSESLNT